MKSPFLRQPGGVRVTFEKPAWLTAELEEIYRVVRQVENDWWEGEAALKQRDLSRHRVAYDELRTSLDLVGGQLAVLLDILSGTLT